MGVAVHIPRCDLFARPTSRSARNLAGRGRSFSGDSPRYVDKQPLRKTEGVSRSPRMSEALLGPTPCEFCVVPNEVDLSRRSGTGRCARMPFERLKKLFIRLALLVATITLIRLSLARACPSLPLRWPSDRNVTCGFSLVAEQRGNFAHRRDRSSRRDRTCGGAPDGQQSESHMGV